MTLTEFSNEFDIIYNNISSNIAPGVNEYEKSVFLTRAQQEFVHNILTNNTFNKDGVDSTTLVRLQLRPLYDSKTISLDLFNQNNLKDILYVLNRELKFENNIIPIIPIAYNDLNKILKNPFYNTGKKAYSVTTNNGFKIYYLGDLIENSLDIYIILDYIKLPKPIILEDLEEGISIEGEVNAQNSELPESTHYEILKIAVQMALAANGVAQS